MKLSELPAAPENITALEAIAVLADTFGENSYRLQVLRKELAELEMKPLLDRFRKEYNGSGWWVYGPEIAIKASRTFDDRPSAVAWLKNKGFNEPEFSKMSFCNDDGTPMTECTLTARGSFEDVPFTIEANYTREGIATKHCKVVAKIQYQVQCDIP
jgi:hypothetical protein